MSPSDNYATSSPAKGAESAGKPVRRKLRGPQTPSDQQSGGLKPLQKIGIGLGAVLFILPFFFDIPNLDEPGERMLSIFLLAIVFWVTEAVPLTATAVLVIILEVLLVAEGAIFDPAAGDAALTEAALPASDYFAALANPVIILFLGGFMIADGAEKYGLDKNIAAVMLKPFSGSARSTVLGLMLITGILSPFMSNTATTATMFAVVIPILTAIKDKKARTGVALSIPLAANVGGIATPVGTPPNAIAVGALESNGIHVSFIDWMIMATPFAAVILIASWVLLCLLFIPRSARIELDMTANWNTSTKAKIFYATAALTILLWMTEPLHGISSNTVGFIPVAILLCLRVMDGSDIKNMDWPVLWLVSGGIALGTGIGATGLDAWLVGSIGWETLGGVGVTVVLCLIGLGFANVMSHSAAANLLVPVAISLAMSLDGVDTAIVAIAVAIACSLGMSLPISTPPNAIAYSTGMCSVKDMAILGIIVGTVSTAILALAMPPLWNMMGLV
ncbi:MAG: SLC13 family permease [Ancrocorticia sp.]|uniref:SLC13 family permease n=1 Tax=Ancrocorticia sp. TaxID=2593684 RepID=UPI003F90206D